MPLLMSNLARESAGVDSMCGAWDESIIVVRMVLLVEPYCAWKPVQSGGRGSEKFWRLRSGCLQSEYIILVRLVNRTRDFLMYAVYSDKEVSKI